MKPTVKYIEINNWYSTSYSEWSERTVFGDNGNRPKLHSQGNSKQIKSGYHAVQNLLTSCVLSESANCKIHKSIILPVALHGYETSSLKLREEWRCLWTGCLEHLDWSGRRLKKRTKCDAS